MCEIFLCEEFWVLVIGDTVDRSKVFLVITYEKIINIIELVWISFLIDKLFGLYVFIGDTVDRNIDSVIYLVTINKKIIDIIEFVFDNFSIWCFIQGNYLWAIL